MRESVRALRGCGGYDRVCGGCDWALEAEKMCGVREGEQGRAPGSAMARWGRSHAKPLTPPAFAPAARALASCLLPLRRALRPPCAPSPPANGSRRQLRALGAGPAPKEPGEGNVSR